MFNKNLSCFRIIINGTGSVNAVPDMANVTLGVVTENESVITAQQMNAETMAQVLAALQKIGIQQNDIETIAYTIEPIYDYVDGTQVFKTYRVTNRIQVTVRQLEMVGEVIDRATAAGANAVSNVNFSVAQPSRYYDKALSKAIRDAVKKALNIERTLNIIVNKIPIKITEKTYEQIPLREAFLATPAPPTPIIAGDITITARIEAVFTYSARGFY